MKYLKVSFLKVFLLISIIFIPAISLSYTSPSNRTILPRPLATVSISETGLVRVKNAVIFYVIGSTFFARTNWGDTYIKWSFRIDNNTKIYKKFGGNATLKDIKVGHVLDIEGKVLSGANGLDIVLSRVVDNNLENEKGSFSGVVTNTDKKGKLFTLKNKHGKEFIVSLTNDTVIKKGALIYPSKKIQKGDKIISVSGIYHKPTETLKANKIEIKVDEFVFKPRNFQGILKNVSSASLPTSVIVNVNGKDYTVYLNKKSLVLTKWRWVVSLKRYLIGDTVRFYGAIRRTVEENEVDAEILRNLNL